MSREKSAKFSEKHGSDVSLDPSVRAQILKIAPRGEVGCARAFQLAAEIKVSPAEMGRAVDLMEIKLVKCQLGLFGYGPAKKAVKAQDPANSDLIAAVRGALIDGQLSCGKAWDIARQFNVPKMTVSAACEAIGIKIKPCQLGAF